MTQLFKFSRRAAALALAAAALSLSACKDDDHDDHPEVDFMRITVGAQTPVVVNSVGAVNGTISISQGVATNVTVEFLDATMQDALGDEADEFQVTIVGTGGITFTRTGPFAGTLTGAAPGTFPVSFAMYHLVDQEEEFGPFNVNITVTAPPTVIAGN